MFKPNYQNIRIKKNIYKHLDRIKKKTLTRKSLFYFYRAC